MGEDFEQSLVFKNKSLFEDFNSIGDDSSSYMLKSSNLEIIDFENKEITRDEKHISQY